MCGIAGIVGLTEKDQVRGKIKAMADCLSHRGPDAEGFFIENNVALAHRRLSIIDLDEKANQPLFDDRRRYSIVFNGEIYNYRDLRRELAGYPFQTDSDTEVILAAFQRYGPDCLERLNGMFAFAIWDSVERKLFAARDRLGVKPFYYAIDASGNFLFASEIRALLASNLIPRRLDERGLYDYILYQSTYAPLTIVEGISQLGAGEYAFFDGKNLSIESYWRIEQPAPVSMPADVASVRRDLQRLLTDSVQCRLVSDVPLGAFLSGGIDSSAIVALMSEISPAPINTFAVGLREKEFDESKYSDLVAEKYKTNHRKVYLTADDFLHELPAALAGMDSPSGDGVNTYVVAKAAKQSGVTVVLSGLGGDELFAGYEYFRHWWSIKRGVFPKMPALLRRQLARFLKFSPKAKHQRAGDLLYSDKLNMENVYPTFRQVVSQAGADRLFASGAREINLRRQLSMRASAIEDFPLLSQLSIGELIGYTPNVLLKDTDQFSMASALEVREPFFDYRLVEYVLQIPDRFKYPKYPKSLLVESLGERLPPAIVHRPKMGFVLPFEKWMRAELREFCRLRIERLADRGLFAAELLRARWDDFLQGNSGVRWSELWHLIVLDEWLDNHDF